MYRIMMYVNYIRILDEIDYIYIYINPAHFFRVQCNFCEKWIHQNHQDHKHQEDNDELCICGRYLARLRSFTTRQ